MLAHGFVSRLTKDIDLFTDRDLEEALAVARGLRVALQCRVGGVGEPPAALRASLRRIRPGDRPGPRDFVDVAALAHRFGPDRLMELAASKDSGLTRETYLDALHAMARLTHDGWAGDGVDPEVETATRTLFEKWRVWLQRALTEPADPDLAQRGF